MEPLLQLKAITVWNPWAWLIGRPFAKKHETRGWYCRHRGQLAIHAAARKTLVDFDEETLAHISRLLGPTWQRDLRTGVVVSVVDMVGCHRTEDLQPDPWDFRLGNFGPGRFAWDMANARFLAEPYEIKGRQGLWNVPVEAAQEIMRRLECQSAA